MTEIEKQEDIVEPEEEAVEETAEDTAKETGVVKWFSNAKGYGFISRDNGKDVFVHHSSIMGSGFHSLSEGERVEFNIEQSPKGPRAANVKSLQPSSSSIGYRSGNSY